METLTTYVPIGKPIFKHDEEHRLAVYYQGPEGGACPAR